MSLARRLDIYIASVPQFDWVTYNCCHFCGGWVREVEGHDPLKGISVRSERDAWRLIAEYGGLAEAISERLARGQEAPAMARVGDIVLMPAHVWGGVKGRCSVGICAGRTAVFITESATIHWPVLEATHVWRLK